MKNKIKKISKILSIPAFISAVPLIAAGCSNNDKEKENNNKKSSIEFEKSNIVSNKIQNENTSNEINVKKFQKIADKISFNYPDKEKTFASDALKEKFSYNGSLDGCTLNIIKVSVIPNNTHIVEVHYSLTKDNVTENYIQQVHGFLKTLSLQEKLSQEVKKIKNLKIIDLKSNQEIEKSKISSFLTKINFLEKKFDFVSEQAIPVEYKLNIVDIKEEDEKMTVIFNISKNNTFSENKSIEITGFWFDIVDLTQMILDEGNNNTSSISLPNDFKPSDYTSEQAIKKYSDLIKKHNEKTHPYTKYGIQYNVMNLIPDNGKLIVIYKIVNTKNNAESFGHSALVIEGFKTDEQYEKEVRDNLKYLLAKIKVDFKDKEKQTVPSNPNEENSEYLSRNLTIEGKSSLPEGHVLTILSQKSVNDTLEVTYQIEFDGFAETKTEVISGFIPMETYLSTLNELNDELSDLELDYTSKETLLATEANKIENIVVKNKRDDTKYTFSNIVTHDGYIEVSVVLERNYVKSSLTTKLEIYGFLTEEEKLKQEFLKITKLDFPDKQSIPAHKAALQPDKITHNGKLSDGYVFKIKTVYQDKHLNEQGYYEYSDFLVVEYQVWHNDFYMERVEGKYSSGYWLDGFMPLKNYRKVQFDANAAKVLSVSYNNTLLAENPYVTNLGDNFHQYLNINFEESFDKNKYNAQINYTYVNGDKLIANVTINELPTDEYKINPKELLSINKEFEVLNIMKPERVNEIKSLLNKQLSSISSLDYENKDEILSESAWKLEDSSKININNLNKELLPSSKIIFRNWRYSDGILKVSIKLSYLGIESELKEFEITGFKTEATMLQEIKNSLTLDYTNKNNTEISQANDKTKIISNDLPDGYKLEIVSLEANENKLIVSYKVTKNNTSIIGTYEITGFKTPSTI